MGTMAHSWIMAFSSEEEAFRAYAKMYPVNPIFLIDTYDTLRSGILNAIKVGKEITEKGGNFGVRLDSGDIQYLSVAVRKKLDEAGCTKATIAVSNDLDEFIINALMDQKTPVNSWGVGTKMVTGSDEAALGGVYKLAARNVNGSLKPTIKFSDNPEKTTIPGVKQVWRLKDRDGMALADILSLEDENVIYTQGKRCVFWHPSADYRHFYQTIEAAPVPLLSKHIENGKQVIPTPSLLDIQKRCKAELDTFDSTYKRLLNPHIYKVSISNKLREVKLELIKSRLGDS
jgi:nicotinate phosphoribosyltransferase